MLHYYRNKKDTDGFFSTIQTLNKALPQWFRKKYKQGIQNAFELRYSNGVTEGLNNKIKLIKRVSYGYRNFYHLRDRIYIIQGLILASSESWYEQTTSKTTRVYLRGSASRFDLLADEL